MKSWAMPSTRELTERESFGPGCSLPPSLLGDVPDDQEETGLVPSAPWDGRAGRRQVLTARSPPAEGAARRFGSPAAQPAPARAGPSPPPASRRRGACQRASSVPRPNRRSGRGVPGHHPACRVDRHDGPGRGLDEVLQERLGLRELAVQVRVPDDEGDRLENIRSSSRSLGSSSRAVSMTSAPRCRPCATRERPPGRLVLFYRLVRVEEEPGRARSRRLAGAAR